jgi:cytidine deaminase
LFATSRQSAFPCGCSRQKLNRFQRVGHF